MVMILKNTKLGKDSKICPYCGMIVDIATHDCPIKKRKNNRTAKENRINQRDTDRELTSKRGEFSENRLFLGTVESVRGA